jgi:hypothetical protein
MMAARGRRTAADVRLLAEVAVAALGGGLLAAAVLTFGEGALRTGLVLFFVAVVTVLAILTVGTLQSVRFDRTKAQAPHRPWEAGRSPQRPGASTYPQAQDSQPQYAQPEPVRAPQLPQSVPWYDDGVGARQNSPQAPHTFRAAPAPAQPDPDTRPAAYDIFDVPGARRSGGRPVRRVVQCPRCGDFDVDASPTDQSFAFACRACHHTWTWRSGRPWPTTVVRPTVTDCTGREAGGT